MVLTGRTIAWILKIVALKLLEASPPRVVDDFLGWIATYANKIQDALKNPKEERPNNRTNLSWRSKMIIVAAVFFLPLLLWFVQPSLGDTTVGEWMATISQEWHSFEGWSLTSRWEPMPTPEPPEEPEEEQKEERLPTSSPSPQAAEATSVADESEIYVVKSGDQLRWIAAEYGVDINCIIAANSSRYPNFDPDSLEIGAELQIPINKPECRNE
jgi:hypothetical protein